MSKCTWWFPVSIKPVRDGWYEWRCGSVTGGEIERAEWSHDGWIRSTSQTLFTPRFKCLGCQWRGLTRPAEES